TLTDTIPDTAEARRFQRVRELFEGALERAPDERVRYLTTTAGDDSAMLREVVALLAALDEVGDSFERESASLLRDALEGSVEPDLAGRRIGPYQIVRLIGYGGMGAVYEGRRADADFQTRVAIKVLRTGAGSELAQARLRLERSILAQLTHRNIAALLDGGVTDDGLPYLAVEYVDGQPITTYCRLHQLGVRERVALFRQVCTAVQYAHRQLVIHRDLKPGNILVAADGTVKLLDFGIAKLLSDADPGMLTRGDQRAYTPEYASPEQVRALPMGVASDVYSLGVVLFELLTGSRPYNLDGKSMTQIERLVCEIPAPRPSTTIAEPAVQSLGEPNLKRLRARLSGDLDAILLTALAKEPEHRYASVDDLGADLRRWLEGHPVAARREWAGYRVRKFVGRHRVETVAAAVVLVALIGGLASSLRQTRIADRERAKTEQVNRFMTGMLTAADPSGRGRDARVADVLSQAARDVDRQQLDPDVEAEIRHAIGQTYIGLGMYDSAEVHIRRAFDLRRSTLGADDQHTLHSMGQLAALQKFKGNYGEGERLARELVQRELQLKPLDPQEVGTAVFNLASVVTAQGRMPEGDSLNLEALRWLRQSTDSTGRSMLGSALHNTGIALQYRGQMAAAESLHRESVQVLRQVSGERSVQYGDAVSGLAAVVQDLGRLDEADSLFRVATAVLEPAYGDSHPLFLLTLQLYA
ncbi:MAG: serine/threonine-protein kinase, partial [Gemmatimonadaceae bacterium]